MTDDLTPEEQEALDNLPRERMPTGLEARVVHAMREHGILARRRRTIEVSNSRVAGVLAASVALMIGAYSIGLHRGAGTRVLPSVELAKPDDRGRADEPSVGALEGKAELPASDPVLEADRAAPEEARQPAQSPEDEVRQKEPPVAGRMVESKRESEAPKKDLATGSSKVAESYSAETPAPAAALLESATRTPALRDNAAPGVTTLTFFLNGSPVIVEAPDSVRVTKDEQGRTLIIYTSDGIIRIRLADAP